MDPVTLKLDPPSTLTGRVVDTQRKAHPGRHDRSSTPGAAIGLSSVFLDTDAEGRFRWDEAPADYRADRTSYHRGYERCVPAPRLARGRARCC